ncbi:TetR/AcrR family transcriptional regulator C-terminal domain-containing protein [Streptomyces sp. VRA16 Mangrove soil]|uniref:TetR/AcrR family transcriptional regulator C-terminal domain-containing protein n=1 Tax=Streptomyces sp. VRA16 Mangrove soil TaxID=2817434 RepID=UPI001A9CFC2F|nr:TetR/AcrR family transcriptional regulator C-terminal domain-containing protein [Streptomyces sp. VRA16 Mangrove soil]MBO1334816.1 TetR/AcrR family transcriptional regulator C-terminal domain-containing protein [Streptomyces sp. VRA16 Mangrove soil]
MADQKNPKDVTKRSAAKPKLDKAHVADTALDLLNDVGLEGLTLRAIAKELNVQAPALYWHFKNKQALLDEMATVMFRRMTAVGRDVGYEPSGGWQEWLLQGNRQLRATLLSYRDGAKVFSGSRFTGIDHGPEMETNLRYLVDAGFTPDQAAWASSTAYLYTLGFVTEEQGMRGQGEDAAPKVDVAERARRLADFPLAAAAGAQLFAAYDERFEEGLRVIVAGIGARYGVG